MKKLLIISLLLISGSIFSQVTTEENPKIFTRDVAKNELSIGAFNLVAFGAIDIAYERILTPNTSWAIEGFILALNRDNEVAEGAFTRNASLTGKFKYFFSDNMAWGFYANGLAMLSGGEYYENYDIEFNRPGEEITYTDLALGFGLGSKFVARQGFFADLSAGIGRNLLNDNSPTIVGQFNVNLGIRF